MIGKLKSLRTDMDLTPEERLEAALKVFDKDKDLQERVTRIWTTEFNSNCSVFWDEENSTVELLNDQFSIEIHKIQHNRN